ncbi:MAG: protein meaA [Beijerinckiaceae bacterium]
MVEQAKATGVSAASAGHSDPPWLFRTYAGHSTAAQSNALYRRNLAKGQTGLSVAFDLPTQTGHDPGHPLARGEVGRVGVSIAHLGDMRALFDGLPLGSMNTSMTINATAPWLMALYIALADEQGAPRSSLQGTTQNDILKEYLSRGTYVFPPAASLRLATDLIRFAAHETPRFNPTNICSYHLQEAGATPAQELAFALANAIAVLETLRDSGVTQDELEAVVGRVSFFVNAGMRFVTEVCKMRAFVELWDEITRGRFAVGNAKFRRFRYGVQVNSLGLTEQQPENNVYRILVSMLGVVLSRNARARAVQLPAWNEALGLPRPIDQQWSLRAQQIVAYETDLLSFPDLFDGNPAIQAKVEELKAQAKAEIAVIDGMGGAVAAIESGYMKSKLVESNTQRIEAIERGDLIVVGVNKYVESEPSPITGSAGAIAKSDPATETMQIAALNAWKSSRDESAVGAALEELRGVARAGANVMPASIVAAKAGVTTGEWSAVMREIFGEYRAPTGVSPAARQVGGDLDDLRERVQALAQKLGRRPALLIGKPGLDGHSNGAEQIAVRARDIGFDVTYDGIRMTAEQLVQMAVEKKVHCVGLSVLSGAHMQLTQDVVSGLRNAGLRETPVIIGGIIPPDDEKSLLNAGVSAVYTPKRFNLSSIMREIVDLIDDRN